MYNRLVINVLWMWQLNVDCCVWHIFGFNVLVVSEIRGVFVCYSLRR